MLKRLTMMFVATTALGMHPSGAFAAESNEVSVSSILKYPNGLSLTDEDLNKIDVVEVRKRAPSSSVSGKNPMSPQYQKLQSDLEAATSPVQFEHVLIKAISESNPQTPADVRFYLATVRPILSVRALAYRVFNIADEGASHHSSRSILVSVAKQVIAASSLVAPTQMNQMIVHYVSEPQTPEDTDFSSIEEFQQYVETQVIPVMNDASARISTMVTDGACNTPFHVDNQMLYSKAKFSDHFARYQQAGMAECLAVYSSLQSALASLHFTSAFYLTGLPRVTEEITKLYGFDGVIDGDGVSAEARKRALLSESRFLTARATKSVNMAKSLEHLRESVRTGLKSWETRNAQNGSAEDNYLLHAGLFGNFDGQTHESQVTLSRVLGSGTPRGVVVSALTGETVEIDAPAFFANAPNDLRTLLPTHFEHEKFNGTGVCADQACQYMTKKIAGVTKKYRNFSQSIADQWSVSVYKPYVIKINGNGNYKAAELKSAARIIGESFGGLLLAGPFTGAIL